jgi:peptide-methionine (R)-S-oxide reductase
MILAAIFLALGLIWAGSVVWANARAKSSGPKASGTTVSETEGTATVKKTDEEWRQALTPEQYRVLRQEGTEMPFANKYWNHHGDGVYTCAGCGQELFASATKFDSGSGWPSYTAPFAPANVKEIEDRTHGMTRVEVECSRCGGHLGHVFDDGPAPTGLRYCINSAALSYAEDKAKEAKLK